MEQVNAAAKLDGQNKQRLQTLARDTAGPRHLAQNTAGTEKAALEAMMEARDELQEKVGRR